MIYYVTGPLGAGKSYYAARKVARALLQGRVVIGNVELRDGWEETIARHNPHVRMSKKKRELYMQDLRRRFAFEPSLEAITKIKISGRGEGRAILVLDEAHNDLNNRDWQKESSREFLRWLTLARKKGYTAYILSQHKDNTDAGARRIATAQVQLVNWKQVTRIPIVGIPLLPWPMFLAVARHNSEAYPAGVLKERPLWREFFPLGWHRNIYDSHQLYGEQDEPGAVWFPLPEGSRYVSLEEEKRLESLGVYRDRDSGRGATVGVRLAPTWDGGGKSKGGQPELVRSSGAPNGSTPA